MDDDQDAPHVTITEPFPDGFGFLVVCTCGHRQDCEAHTAETVRVRHAIRHAPWQDQPSKRTRACRP